MEERRRTTTIRQLELMLEFMEVHRDLALGRVRSKEARAVAQRLWQECAELLNALGPARTAKEWSKVWNDQKTKVRGKLVKINTSHHATGGGPSNAPTLTPLEERLANIIGRDVGPLPNVAQVHFTVSEGDNGQVNGQGNDQAEETVDIEEMVAESNSNTSPPLLLNIPNELEDYAHPVIAEPVEPEPVGGPGGVSPLTDSVRTRERRRRARASRISTIQSAPQIQTARSTLDEARSMVLKMEEMRAEAALLHAKAAHENAKAAHENAQAFNTLSQSFKLIAESIDRYCALQGGQPPNQQQRPE